MLELQAVDKHFGSVHANKAVSLTLRRGSVHAVLGENGAGKSTLMNILFGVQRPDSGAILIDGEVQQFKAPKDAIAAGVGMVFQHFGLVPELTALDNIALGAETTRRGLVDRAAARRRINELSDELKLKVPLQRRVASLTIAEQQRVEILKALYRGARILILDEPTALLAPQERLALFAAVKRLQTTGVSVLFITHKLDEAEYLADDVTVMRHGAVVARRRIGAVDRTTLVADMVGAAPTRHKRSSRSRGADAVGLEGVSITRAVMRPLRNINLKIFRGEILGVAGIDGHGHQVLCELLAGLREPDAGQLTIAGEVRHRWNRAVAMELGVGFVPEDRLVSGVARQLSIAENLTVNRLKDERFFPFGWTSKKKTTDHAAEMIERFDIRCSGGAQPVGSLSGGNVQKVVLARELSTDPDVVVVCEPTRGLDIAAIAHVHNQLAAAAERDAAVVVQSSDLDELLTVADRIVVFREGTVVADLPNRSLDSQKLGALMLGSSEEVAS